MIDVSVFLHNYERDIADAIKKYCRPGWIILDVGANIGAHTIRFARITGVTGKVFAFEPTSYAYDELVKNISLNSFKNNIIPFQIALSDQNLNQQNINFRSSGRFDGKRIEGTTTVDFKRLDDWCYEQNVQHVDLIKLDVDRNEFSVLNGAKDLLQRCKPLIFLEVGAWHFDNPDTNPLQILSELNYKFWDTKKLVEYPSLNSIRRVLPPNDQEMSFSINLIAAQEFPENTIEKVPLPSPMNIDRESWFSQLNLSNFVNTYYQYRDLQSIGKCKKILIIGPGQGLDTLVLKWRGYDITTLDIDNTFCPDYIGSVHSMDMFSDGQFDAVIASHVLEHLAEPFLEQSLREIARVGKYALIYLPVHGRHVQARLIPGFRDINISLILDVFNCFEKPDGITSRYMANQHFWEIGMRGYRVKDMVKRLYNYFEIISVYRNQDWLPSQNFIAKSNIISGVQNDKK